MVPQNEQLASELIQHMVQLEEIFSVDLEGVGQCFSRNFVLLVSSFWALEGLTYLLYFALYWEICICSLAVCDWINQLKYTSKGWMFLKGVRAKCPKTFVPLMWLRPELWFGRRWPSVVGKKKLFSEAPSRSKLASIGSNCEHTIRGA